jgi:hypothetical protein
LPGGEVEEGRAVIWEGYLAKIEDANIKPVTEHGGETGVGTVKVGDAVDFGEGATGGAQGERLADGIGEGWIGGPAVDDVRAAITMGAEFDGDADEAAGRRSADAAVLIDQVMEAAFDINTEILEVAGIHPVDGGFKEAAIEVVTYGIIE